jgi:diguanylate cyclase (GGDEF)-like protein/PAS domain S-box-containing protein
MSNSLWRLWLGCGAAVIALFIALPDSPALDGLYLLLALSAPVAILVGTLRFRPVPRAPWYWLIFGECLLFTAEIVWLVLDWQGLEPYPSLADAMFLTAYPCLAIGLALLVRHRTATRELTSLLDAAIVSIGIGLVTWVFVINPLLADSAATPLERIVSVAYPLFDLLVLAVLARLAFGGGARTVALLLLTAGFLTNLGADVRYLFGSLTGSYVEYGWLDATWMTAYLLIGSAALHPSMRTLSTPEPTSDETLTPLRLAALAAASVTAPTVLLLQWSRNAPLDVPAVTIAAIAMFLLVVVRLSETGHMIARTRARGEARFRSLVHNASDVIVVVDRAGVITFASPAVQRVWNHSSEDVLGIAFSRLLHADDADRFVLAFESALDSDLPMTFEGRIWSPSQQWRSFEAITTNLLSDPSVGGVVLTCRDTTDRVRLEQQLTYQAFHDPLTGLANRALFGDRVERALGRATSHERVVAVLFVDLDDFKTVNDGLGHGAGDALLREVGERLTSAVQVHDTAARLGGDEFAVLVEDAADRDAVTALAERLIVAFGRPFVIEGSAVTVSASIGLAARDRDDTAESLIRDADIAMYSAKTAGKCEYAWFDPSMRARAVDRWRLRTDLVTAQEGKEFFLEYQPIVDLSDGRILGAEALLRWRHPTRGIIPPGEFIPLAEQTGQIIDIGDRVLRAATAEARRWQHGRTLQRPLCISVNVSPVQLTDRSIVDRVAAALDRSGLPPDALVLELTESTLMANVEHSASLLHELRALGVTIAIDDFGTGYSSLAYLRQFPVDLLKIDRSFVSGLDTHTESHTLTSDIISLARTLDVTSVAEGIENAEQLAVLRSMGCALGQGYHLGRPMSAEAFVQRLDRRHDAPVAVHP